MTGSLTERPLIENIATLDGEEVAFFADPHHVLKNVRNHFFKYKIIYLPVVFVLKYGLLTNEVKLDIVKDLVEFDKGRENKVSPHLKQVMFKLGNFAKMNVGMAKKVLSQETCSSIEYMIQHEGWDESCRATGKFCEVMGKWISILSCRSRDLAFSLNDRDKLDEQMSFLTFFMEFMSQLQFSKRQKALKPCQKGALLSTKSIMDLANKLLYEEGFEFFRGGNTLSDPVESLHGQIRNFCKNPTCVSYPRFLKAVCVTQAFSEIKGANCDYDTGEFLTKFKDMKRVQEEEEEVIEDCQFFIDADFEERDFTDSAVLAKMAAYVLSRTIMSKRFKCTECIEAFVVKPEHDGQAVNCLIELKEFKKGSFLRPSVLANNLFQAAEALFMSNRDLFYGQEKMIDKISSKVSELIEGKLENLPLCHLDKIVRRFIRFRCFKWADFLKDLSLEENAPWIEAESHSSRSSRSTTAQQLQ